jgi:hypothetical protein
LLVHFFGVMQPQCEEADEGRGPGVAPRKQNT